MRRTLTGTGAKTGLVLAALVTGTVFVAVAAPRSSEAARTRALAELMTSIPAAGRTVQVSSDYFSVASALGSNDVIARYLSAAQLAGVGARIRATLAGQSLPLRPASARWSGLSTGAYPDHEVPPSLRATGLPRIQVLYRAGLRRNARLASGTMPDADTVTGASPSTLSANFDVAVTERTATRFSVHAGSVITLVPRLTFTVTGILRPVRTGSSFWTQDPSAAAASFIAGSGGQGYWLGSVFAGPAELKDVERVLDSSSTTLSWSFPLRLGGITADRAGALAAELRAAYARAGVIRSPNAPAAAGDVSSGVLAPLEQFVRTQAEAGRLLSLLYVSLAVVALAVLLLGAMLLAQRRAGEFAMLRARGAAGWQVAALALGAHSVVVLPAAVLGAAVAVALTPHSAEPLAWWLAALVTLAALAAGPVLARTRPAAAAAGERADAPPAATGRTRRLVTELALVLAAAGGVGLLRQQGQQAAGAGWYASATPALVGVPVAIAVVRAYPLAFSWLARLAGRRPGVVTFVGLARATRTTAAAVLPAFALVLVLTVVGFGAMLRAGVSAGQATASWRAEGADAIVDASNASGPLTPKAIAALAAVPGVRRTAALSVLTAVATDGTQLDIVLVNPARYAALIAGTPLPAFPAAALAQHATTGHATTGVPVPALSSRTTTTLISGQPTILIGSRVIQVRVAATVPGPPGVATGAPFLVLPYWALGVRHQPPNVLLINGQDVSGQRLRAVAKRVRPDTVVTLRSQVLATLTAAPLPRSVYLTYVAGAIVAACLAAAVLLLTLALGARAREVTLSRMFTMGLSPGQARSLVIAEVLPSVLAAAAGGILAAAVLVPLIGPAIDLSFFTGAGVPVVLHTDAGVLGYLAAGLCVLAALTLAAQAAVTRLRGSARALRAGGDVS